MSETTTLPNILIYSGPMCSGCDEVKAYLKERNIPYIEKNIRADMPTMIEFRRKGYDILPVIEAGDQVISEYESLDQLQAMLEEVGYR